MHRIYIKTDALLVNRGALVKLEIFPATQSCPHAVMIAVMKNNKEKSCLNPEFETIKDLLKTTTKGRSERAH